MTLKKIMTAMSGGVDSSAAALLLLRDGYEVCGATMKLFHNEQIGLDTESACCSLADVEDARTVAHLLGFDHHVFGFSDAFRTQVIERFAQSYERGLTPNPCVDCNRYVKFPMLLDRALFLGMDGIATGHYARTEHDPRTGRWLLKKARDTSKDQTYVLYTLTQETLSRTLFPLGGLLKSEARTLAFEAGLPVASKSESQDICFVPDGDYTRFLRDILHVPSVPGPVKDISGKTLGTHSGLLGYTVGQRKGLPVTLGEKTFVVAKDATSATLTVGRGGDLYTDELTASNLNWISIEHPDTPMEVTAKTRYKAPEAEAVLTPLENERVRLRFRQPQRAVTPGQAVVFYQGDIVVGGGTIE